MENLEKKIEALIFVSNEPVTPKEIKACLEAVQDNNVTSEEVPAEATETTAQPNIVVQVELDAIQNALDNISAKYSSEDYTFELKQIDNGYQFMTKPEYHSVISILTKQKSKKKLSTAAMECLAIIAYKQPITKMEVEAIRGVNCDYTLQKLLEKELIEITGRSDMAGKPLLYGTSKKFMDYFGLASVNDLPKPKDIEQPQENSIGEPVEQ